jgi:PAS domain S-box-containing protein
VAKAFILDCTPKPVSRDRHWRALLERTQDVVTVLDESGTIQYENRAAQRVLGYDPDDRVGDHAFEPVHPDDRATVVAAFGRVVAAEGTQRVEHRYRTADGDWLWLESVASRVADLEDGEYVVTSRDIDDRRRAEAALRERESRLSMIAENARDVLWLFDADFTSLLFVNSQVEDVYGLSPETLKADPMQFLEAVHPDDRDAVRDGIDRLVGGERVDMEYRVNPGDDFERWVSVQGTPVTDGGGEVTAIAGFSRDVTDRKRTERRLAHQNEQLTLLNRVVRHEIRNDVSIVLGWLGELREAVPAERHRDVARLVEAGEHVMELTHALEAFTKSIDDDRPMRVRDVDLLAVLQEEIDRAVEAYAHATVVGPRVDGPIWTGPAAATADPPPAATPPADRPNTGGRMRSTPPKGPRSGPSADEDHEGHLEPGRRAASNWVEAGTDDGDDPANGTDGPLVRGGPLLSVVFRNLLNNGIAHNDGDPRVEVSVTVDEGAVVVRVADDGPGLPTDEADRLLGRDEWGLADDGTGVGLHMVDLVVGAYGGDVRFREGAAPGVVVEVDLPLAADGRGDRD